MIELSKEERALIEMVRKYGIWVDFSVEKRPTKDHPNGIITRVVVIQSIKIDDAVAKLN